MQPEEQGVQRWVVAGGGRDLVDFGQAGVGDGPPGGGQPGGLGDLQRGVVRAVDQAVVFGVPIEAAQGGDEVFGGAASAAGVAPDYDVDPHVGHELFDFRWGGFVQAAVTPLGAVHAGAARRHQTGHDWDVGGEGRHRLGRDRRGGQFGGGDAHPREQQPRGVRLGLPSRGGPGGGILGSGHAGPPPATGNLVGRPMRVSSVAGGHTNSLPRSRSLPAAPDLRSVGHNRAAGGPVAGRGPGP